MNAATECRVIVFARAPQAGCVKTRLVPALGADGAALLQEDLTRRTLATSRAAEIGPVELCCTPTPDHPFFRECVQAFGISITGQHGNDLGTRMANALETALRSGPALLVGTDCPTLKPCHLQRACDALADDDAVLIPAEDGGYVLIGLARFEPILFENIEWGRETVMTQTRSRLAAHGFRWRELETLWDVDRPEDLARMRAAGLIDAEGMVRQNEHESGFAG